MNQKEREARREGDEVVEYGALPTTSRLHLLQKSVLKDVRGAKQSKAKISKDLDKIPLTQIYFGATAGASGACASP